MVLFTTCYSKYIQDYVLTESSQKSLTIMKERMREHEYRAQITGGSEKANPQEAFCANSVLTSSAYGVRSFSSPASSRISCSSSKPSCPNTRFSFQVS